jgi:hypothetical protein
MGKVGTPARIVGVRDVRGKVAPHRAIRGHTSADGVLERVPRPLRILEGLAVQRIESPAQYAVGSRADLTRYILGLLGDDRYSPGGYS